MDPNHGTVYTHDWRLKTVCNKAKTMELNRNAYLVLWNINNAIFPHVIGTGMIRTQEQGGKANKNNKGGAIDDNDLSDVAGSQR